jgi:hypothetical protein
MTRYFRRRKLRSWRGLALTLRRRGGFHDPDSLRCILPLYSLQPPHPLKLSRSSFPLSLLRTIYENFRFHPQSRLPSSPPSRVLLSLSIPAASLNDGLHGEPAQLAHKNRLRTNQRRIRRFVGRSCPLSCNHLMRLCGDCHDTPERHPF